jgi:hypothetical protein
MSISGVLSNVASVDEPLSRVSLAFLMRHDIACSLGSKVSLSVTVAHPYSANTTIVDFVVSSEIEGGVDAELGTASALQISPRTFLRFSHHIHSVNSLCSANPSTLSIDNHTFDHDDMHVHAEPVECVDEQPHRTSLPNLSHSKTGTDLLYEILSGKYTKSLRCSPFVDDISLLQESLSFGNRFLAVKMSVGLWDRLSTWIDAALGKYPSRRPLCLA